VGAALVATGSGGLVLGYGHGLVLGLARNGRSLRAAIGLQVSQNVKW